MPSTPVDDDKNEDAQYPHGDADEATLQEQPEQRAYIHLHHAGSVSYTHLDVYKRQLLFHQPLAVVRPTS